MNKISLTILVIAAMLLTFAGCKKEGVYNPKKKISRIFKESSGSQGKKLSETWTWNGDLLDKITSPYGDFTMFEYDGKQLKCVRSSYGSRYEFTYDGKKVKECNRYTSNGKLDATYTFTHDGSKISKITITHYEPENYDDYKSFKFSPIDMMFPQTQLAKDVAKPNFKGMTKSTKQEIITLTWDGKNVSKAVCEYYIDNKLNSTTYEYTYDDKSNPYYCSLYDFLGYLGYMSKNNVTKEACTYSSGGYYEGTYSYTYDGKFPTEEKNYGENSYYHITYYEYQ